MNDLSHFSVNKSLRCEIPMLKSDLCDYSDAYIAVKERITVIDTDDVSRRNQMINLKNSASFKSCTSKINNAFTGNAESLDVVMPMYNLLEYNRNYYMISGACQSFIEIK